MENKAVKYSIEFVFGGYTWQTDALVPGDASRNDAKRIFCKAMTEELVGDGYPERPFCITKSDEEFGGVGGRYQTYWMDGEYVAAEVWFCAYES